SAVAAPPASTPAALPVAPAAPTAVAGPRRSGIQIALIVVGISLLSVFAVFGLVYAFVTYGSTVRMAIIIGGTLATMVAAGVLARRGLGSTAEGIAALGTVMLVLDAWALRLNDPAGLGSTPEALYWGTALLIVGATAALWSRTTRLATPGVAGAGLLPVGAALVTLHAVRELLPAIGAAPETAAALAALIVAAASWIIVPNARPVARSAARAVALIIGAAGATVALPLLVELDPGARYSPVIAGLVLAAAALLHVVTLARSVRAAAPRAGTTLVLSAIGGGAALAAVVGAVVSAARFEQDRVIVSAPLIAAVVIAILAEQGWRRSAAGSPWRTTLAAATVTATALTAIAAGLAAIVASAAFVEAGTQGLEVIPLGIGDPVASGDPATVAALAALALCLGLIAASWAALGVLVRRARALTLIAAIVLVAAVPLLPAWWAVMAVFAVLALGAAAGLIVAERVTARDARRALIALCIPLATGAALGAFVTGWAVPRGWVVGLVIALLTIALARPSTSITALRAAFVALGAALVLGSMPELAGDLERALPALQLSPGSLVVGGAAVIIVTSQLGRLAVLEQRVVGIVALGAAGLASTTVSLPALDEALTLALLAGALALVAVRAPRGERLVARALLPLVVARGIVLGVDGTGLDPALVATIAVGSLAVVAVVALLTAAPVGDRALDARARSWRSTLAEPGLDRVASDGAAALAGLVLVADAAVRSARPELVAITVLMLAVLALVTAISRDGLIGSTSPRRFVGWVALGLATIALWMRLADAGERGSEPYVLPLAGAMLLIVAAGALLGRRRGAAPSRTAAPLTSAALLVALVPSAAQSADGTDARGIVVALVAVALAIVPLLAERRIDERLPGMSGALVGTGLTALGLLALAHALDLLLTANGSALTGAALLRAALVVLVPSAVAVAARVLAEGRLRDIATIAALGTAALSAGALGLTGAVEPVELVSLPLALAAIAIGTMHLDAVPAARSWPWLGPGMAVLLVPSLLAIDAAGEPLWRAVALGVAAASVFAGGLWRRLQAPFVIGGTVLLVHLLVQSWPLLDLVGRSVEWWLWLGLAGVLIIVIAARFERRGQNVRDTATRIAQLR
ncbi:SCO7613 C-terminal domain-containing membrane protein, partial [Microcella sp.]|uniref:SCO7613 C-terminal domain-containing membrane protein n=1 Tax=Microcella sp. TaxID=1913979 RepID=UPI00391AD0D7